MANIWRKIMIKTGCYKQQSTEENHNESQQQSLMPTLIEENEPQYLPVKEIGEKLDSDKSVRNIALTEPYGSGKSSVLYTLQQRCTKYKYLQISLATLESYDISEESEKEKTKEDVEQLNRLIEYSILQQLIYREKYATVPNSRIKRIFHFEEKSLCKWTTGIVGFFIAYLIAFEPNWLRVEVMYRIFDLGPVVNSIFDILSVAYMIFGLFVCTREILSSYCGYRLSKLNLKDGEIELKEASIFNKHLDEIIYFFQRTKYDVVIIEDLDRFNTSDIYLKLRELNQLINESKEIGRHIVFIYAVKDDVFKDAQRAKFFDYISTVIPVINPSNSKYKLKHELQIRGYNDIADDDLEEMAFFINDMRLLRNIANEYKQYRDRLCAAGQITLNPTKLLGMIVYKNCFPNDFAQLHNRGGKVYQCISSKPQFIAYAQQQLEEQKTQLEKNIQYYQQHSHLTKKDLRAACAYQITVAMPQVPKSILIDGNYKYFTSIVGSESLFEKILAAEKFTYRYQAPTIYGNYLIDEFNISQTGLNLDLIYWNRKKALEELPQEIKREKRRIDNEERRIKSLRLYQFFTLYNMEQCEDFTNIELEPLQNIFLRRSYIDEDYYDYISYFYPDMITQNDRDLLLAMKQAHKSDYNANIEKIENFAKKIPLYVFDNDAVLNNKLTDFLISHRGDKKFEEKFELLMKRIEREDAPLEFIAQYYQNGTQPRTLFERFIEWNPEQHWAAIMAYSVESERFLLIEGWLKFCQAAELLNEQKDWLNDNYAFLTKHVQSIGLEAAKSLSKGRKYIQLTADSNELLAFVIEHELYELNKGNLCLVVNYLSKTISTDISNLNLKRIRSTKNEHVVAYVEQNIAFCIKEFSHTINDEDEKAILFILNNGTINSEKKRDYLQTQQNRILNIETIVDDAKDMAVELFLLAPRWENIAAYFAYSENKATISLKHYIEHYKTELEDCRCEDTITGKGKLFDALIGSNILEISAYKAIVNSFEYTLKSEEYLAELAPDRLDCLIDAGMVAYTSKNIKTISIHRASTIAKYLIHHKDKYLENIGCITYSSELALCLLDSPSLTNKEKIRIAAYFNSNIIAGKRLLANKLCSIQANEPIQLDNNSLIAIITHSHNLKHRLAVVTQVIRMNPKSIWLIESLLQGLSSPYADIVVRNRKFPMFENKNHNKQLLEALKLAGYLSYSETSNGLKIRKKIR